ncbi:hypothetical protein L1281_000668 [Neisseria sp. HSC-16F19]|nr:hypothetical protein [Neisseria sp. HSC-16F19]MCP2040088.1 hypothetical protein [Neisseria sp. HSC-16F19]
MGRLLFWLLLAAAAWLLWRRLRPRRPAPVPTAQPSVVDVPRSEGDSPFRRWLAVLHGDDADAAALERAYYEVLDMDTAVPMPPQEALCPAVAEVLDPAYAFAVDWKDGDSFAGYADDMAARFGFALDWDGLDVQDELPEALMPVAYRQFLAQGAVLYNADTDADFYFLMIVPTGRRAAFEAASAAWGLNFRTADMPF